MIGEKYAMENGVTECVVGQSANGPADSDNLL